MRDDGDCVAARGIFAIPRRGATSPGRLEWARSSEEPCSGRRAIPDYDPGTTTTTTSTAGDHGGAR